MTNAHKMLARIKLDMKVEQIHYVQTFILISIAILKPRWRRGEMCASSKVCEPEARDHFEDLGRHGSVI